jgi:type I restriction enzyme S subunit
MAILSDICEYGKGKILVEDLDKTNYISTENMIPNKGGVTDATALPSVPTTSMTMVGDVLVSNIRPYFKKIWFANKEGGCSADVLCIRANKETDSQFLYYLLSQQEFFDYVMAGAKGCKMPRGDKQHIMNWEVNIPNIETQQKIANILSSLDDKIEVNRRINEQLEELAQALFKSWFVDFEPFKDGEFVESELGMIPEGWKVGTLGELIEIKYGKDHKKLDDGNIPVYGSGGIMRYVNKSLFTGESVLIPRKGTLNNVMYVNRDFWTVDTMFFSKMKVPNIAIFVYLFLSKKDLASMNSGSATLTFLGF